MSFYIFLSLLSVTFVVLILFICEQKTNKRLFPNVRGSLDEKINDLYKKLDLFDFVGEKIEKEIIDQVAEPINKTKEKYNKIKTGEKDIKSKAVSRSSKHIQHLLKEKK